MSYCCENWYLGSKILAADMAADKLLVDQLVITFVYMHAYHQQLMYVATTISKYELPTRVNFLQLGYRQMSHSWN